MKRISFSRKCVIDEEVGDSVVRICVICEYTKFSREFLIMVYEIKTIKKM